jgi:hypothetical protein
MSIVPTVMCVLALAAGTPIDDPLPFLWIATSARWAYGADRYLDGKTEDTPESLILALITAVAILDASGLPHWGLVEAVCVQSYGPFKRAVPFLKPFYVGALWSCATTIVPHALAHVDTSPRDALAMALLTTAVSNHADIPDVGEDRANGIHTIPVMFGPSVATAFSVALCAGAVGVTSMRAPGVPNRRRHHSMVRTPCLTRVICM